MIPVMNVSRQYKAIQQELDNVALEILHSGQYILGKQVETFEKQFAEYCGVKYAVGVGNGTDALVIALRACGVKPGDEVITCAMSFFATAEAIVSVGARPVFVDCTNDTYLLDVSKLEKAITVNTKAIIPIHLYGQCVDMDEVNKVAEKYHLRVIEDAAQGAGACYKNRKAGSFGDVGCVSFFPTKNLGAAGDGGIILTNDECIYRQCLALRAHGSGNNGLYTYKIYNKIERLEENIDFKGNLPKYYNFIIGYNSRLDAIQAGILSIKLKYLDQWNLRRREIAEQYNKKIRNSKVNKTCIADYNIPIYYVYIVTVEHRDEFRKYLEIEGVGSGVYFPVALHRQRVFKELGYQEGDMPNAEYIADHGVAIPMFPELTQREIDKVIDVVNSWNPDKSYM